MELRCRLYHLLGMILEFARNDDYEGLRDYSREFSAISCSCYDWLDDYLSYEFDNCRQSCLMVMTLPEQKEYFMEDANKRFEDITNNFRFNRCSLCDL